MAVDILLSKKYDLYINAVKSFEQAMGIDINNFSGVICDVIKNGRIQKFEYVTEFTWKILKKILYYKDAIDSNSPKQVIKNFYKAGYINEDIYEILFQMIEDRNLLSHIYNEDEFNAIHNKLNGYLSTVQELIKIIGTLIN